MTTAEDPQSVWDDYYTRLRQRRLSEAQRLLAAAREAGVNDDTTLYLDFQHFSADENDIRKLHTQLSESYEVSVAQDADSDYWFLDGTTRPAKMTLTAEQIVEWVEFMANVSRSHTCVFSTWTLSETESHRQWSNKTFEADAE